MDFNAFYEGIKNYLDIGTIATVIVSILSIVAYVTKSVKNIKDSFASTENEALKAFKAAIPKELYVSIESIAKKELSKITDEIKDIVNEKFLAQIKENTELTQAIAKALITIKSIPDSYKEDIAKLLEIKDAKTTGSLKVELLPEEKIESTSANVLID